MQAKTIGAVTHTHTQAILINKEKSSINTIFMYYLRAKNNM